MQRRVGISRVVFAACVAHRDEQHYQTSHPIRCFLILARVVHLLLEPGPEEREDVGQAKATHPEVGDSGDGSHRLPHGRGGWARSRGASMQVAQAKATHPEVRGSDDGSLILPHGGDD